MFRSSQSNQLPSIDLTGQVAIVTGGGSGIGRACTSALRAAGANVVAVDLRFSGELEMGETADIGSSLLEARGDVSSEEDVRRLFANVIAAHGRIDALVNSAGVIEHVKRTIDQDLADWERVMSVNAKGTFLCCREAGRSMVSQRSGAIVNIGSVAGLVGIPASNAYGPSKAAVAHMTRSLACEWARFGVRVNCVAPGYIDAPMAHELFDGNLAAQEAALKRVPMARLGSADEIANVVLFLCSPLSSYVTGTVLPVDGGWTVFGGASR